MPDDQTPDNPTPSKKGALGELVTAESMIQPSLYLSFGGNLAGRAPPSSSSAPSSLAPDSGNGFV
jgi:hypothetical protein